mmetsp:Transcript_57313/g.125512  ORF Transcript_57313/g.125512 Transcript_57313/m.125512 type:complete len:604 (-) Transcript_57313:353-2164(-)|eukprot:CAMPEP_0206531310 /NCGR_PEP_ID=MMETSP0325_2-20121206/3687_1 /ASSEMBLY_ACC=CAM_ASM_000347 /TAXON_ID=2866 /ORGANISM="Crypthecodinium cohnii, Strain Seligo" /LENGTH=603 /DNA_ID=CAMNT_0054027525 /DNA_START=194 /DNA_END=2005 /DNA_ORIENTATION=+
MPAPIYEDEEQIDDISVGLQMQQFLDEWSYRVLHAGMAVDWDHYETLFSAISLVQAHGLSITENEKLKFARLDEQKLVRVLVARLGRTARRTFEHFALQLQLFVSAATRTRGAIDEGGQEDVRKSVEEGDQAITQHILKRAVVEAAQEIAELIEVHESWESNMLARRNRLQRAAGATQDAQTELDRVNADALGFRGSQNAKSWAALTTLLKKCDCSLAKVLFCAWHSYHVARKEQTDLEAGLEGAVQKMQSRLDTCKSSHVAATRAAFANLTGRVTGAFLASHFRAWGRSVRHSAEERHLEAELEKQQKQVAALSDSQLKAARGTLTRLCSTNLSALRDLSFQLWRAATNDARADREFSEKVEGMRKEIQSRKVCAKGAGSGLLHRMASMSDWGLLSLTIRSWSADIRLQHHDRMLEKKLVEEGKRADVVKVSQKSKAYAVSAREISMEESNMLLMTFLSWQMYLKTQRVVRHYSGQMENKRRQLESVRMMFNQFATDLGDISHTPRRRSGSKGRSSQDAAAVAAAGRPPQLPASNSGSAAAAWEASSAAAAAAAAGGAAVSASAAPSAAASSSSVAAAAAAASLAPAAAIAAARHDEEVVED